MTDGLTHIPLVFYCAKSGHEPVRAWLPELDPEDRRTIGQDLMRVQFGWPIGMPLCRSLGGGLWEVRSNLSSQRIGRVFFCFADGVLVALHGIIKKTQKTPPKELDTARARMKEVQQ
jgi:phage-related protein